ncbi:MAG: hypothetical protein C0475_02070 [Planctomyces sp.]|nr:hypothetical protein [Planctomyces sp.]MBA4038894.1 hypothetical protein [Planctomyces sp.]MBA4119852.1 hypothetical protein [Isosphaera sp.]
MAGQSNSGQTTSTQVGNGHGKPVAAADLSAEARALLGEFNWQPQPEAWRLVNELVKSLVDRNAWAARLAGRMRAETGTRLIDWVDHIAAPEGVLGGEGLWSRLQRAGYRHEPKEHAPGCHVNDKGILPPVIVGREPTTLVAIKVESVVEFMQAHELDHAGTLNDGLEMGEGSRLRMALGAREGDTQVWAIERHGLWGFGYDDSTPAQRLHAMEHLTRLRTRRRRFDTDAQGLAHTHALVDAAVAQIGQAWACDLFFKAEREYWMRRNRAAQVQHARQQRLGLGWANHDHHTYRCSRQNFPAVVGLWEKLGFHCRERFYAGAQAGWGAQVMENPTTGITTFNDVDMAPEELFGDFSHQGFTRSLPTLSTVGLWVGLHGEAVLQAGMHHLEAQFDWQALVDQLEREAHIKTMAPFTTFPYLRQAFTEGERWAVEPARIAALADGGLITREQAETFAAHGAIGSHLENLERNDGFKGFNQTGVSDIIARTDPRVLSRALAGA